MRDGRVKCCDCAHHTCSNSCIQKNPYIRTRLKPKCNGTCKLTGKERNCYDVRECKKCKVDESLQSLFCDLLG